MFTDQKRTNRRAKIKGLHQRRQQEFAGDPVQGLEPVQPEQRKSPLAHEQKVEVIQEFARHQVNS